MFEQDYMMRLVKEIARVLAKILFNIDSETFEEDLSQRIEKNEILDDILDLVDDGNINEAENQIYDLMKSGRASDIETALLFYSYLNDQTDEFLETNNFSREEIKLGIETLADSCGLNGLVNVFVAE